MLMWVVIRKRKYWAGDGDGKSSNGKDRIYILRVGLQERKKQEQSIWGFRLSFFCLSVGGVVDTKVDGVWAECVLVPQAQCGGTMDRAKAASLWLRENTNKLPWL